MSDHQQSLVDMPFWSLREIPGRVGKEFLWESEALLLSCLVNSSVTVGTEMLPCTEELLRHRRSRVITLR